MSWIELIIFGVFVLITVGGWISGAVKKTEQRRTRVDWEGTGQMGGVAAPSKEPSSTLPRAHELAEMRRERLAQLAAERKRAKGLGMTVTTAKGPQNLTVPERARRVNAIEQYQERARQLQRQRAAKQARRAQPKTPTPVRQPQAQVARPKPKKVAPAPVRPSGAQRDNQIKQRHITSSITGREKTLGSVKEQHISDHPAGEVHRLVTDAKAVAIDQPVRAGARSFLSGSIRDAIIAKELLDRPVGLRDLSELPGESVM